jgi:glycerol-3-phosphate acyltransferase PlsY
MYMVVKAMFVQILIYSLLAYLSGSVAYCHVYSFLFHSDDVTINSRDHTPGFYNAFKNGGKACGLFTLTCDILKAFLPVYLYTKMCWFAYDNIGIVLVMAAPVLGDCFPVFHPRKGGKGFATAFGVLLAILPYWQPLFVAIVLYYIFSYILVISSMYYRWVTILTLFLILCMFMSGNPYLSCGCVAAAFIMDTRMILSPEEKGVFSLHPIWKKD